MNMIICALVPSFSQRAATWCGCAPALLTPAPRQLGHPTHLAPHPTALQVRDEHSKQALLGVWRLPRRAKADSSFPNYAVIYHKQTRQGLCESPAGRFSAAGAAAGARAAEAGRKEQGGRLQPGRAPAAGARFPLPVTPPECSSTHAPSSTQQCPWPGQYLPLGLKGHLSGFLQGTVPSNHQTHHALLLCRRPGQYPPCALLGRPVMVPLGMAYANGGRAAERAVLTSLLRALAPLRREGAEEVTVSARGRACWWCVV